jgi:flagellar protein FliS
MVTHNYESQKVLSASPMELIRLLYDYGIRCLGQAQNAFTENGDIDQMNRFHKHLLEAQNAVTELACSLNVEQGGDMAVQIERLYEFMLHHLIEANRQNCKKPVDDVKKMLTELRDGWVQAMASVPHEEQPIPVSVERTSSFRFSG